MGDFAREPCSELWRCQSWGGRRRRSGDVGTLYLASAVHASRFRNTVVEKSDCTVSVSGRDGNRIFGPPANLASWRSRTMAVKRKKYDSLTICLARNLQLLRGLPQVCLSETKRMRPLDLVCAEA